MSRVITRLRAVQPSWNTTALAAVADTTARDPFRILVSCLLSLRTRDETTGPAAARLFALADTPAAMLGLARRRIERAIFPVGFYRTKARVVQGVSRELPERFGGRVPADLDALLTLPGVGRTLQQLREVVRNGGGHRYLIHDRDRIFAKHLDDSIRALGVEVLRSPVASPKANSVVNARTVLVVGKTQARSDLSIHDASTNATVAGAADANGAFAITLPIGTGTNAIQVTATDPAGNVNVASVTVRSIWLSPLKASKLQPPVVLKRARSFSMTARSFRLPWTQAPFSSFVPRRSKTSTLPSGNVPPLTSARIASALA